MPKAESKYDSNEEESKSASKEEETTESDEERMVDREFKALMNESQKGQIAKSENPMAQKIADGFRINWMNMRDAGNGEVMWESGEWGEKMWKKELKVRGEGGGAERGWRRANIKCCEPL